MDLSTSPFGHCRPGLYPEYRAFDLVSDYQTQGDQQQAIEKLSWSLDAGNQHQMLLEVTGSDKTFTMANLVARQNKPTLIIRPPAGVAKKRQAGC
ncbi:MAG: DEAD/DEAH box helicase family protein [Akkermansiaceae bacterium]